jgi:transcriptional regulator NrdR family protein
MKCPNCGYSVTNTIDSRPTADGEMTRRRRICPKCERAFTTLERMVKTKRGKRFIPSLLDNFSNAELLDELRLRERCGFGGKISPSRNP